MFFVMLMACIGLACKGTEERARSFEELVAKGRWSANDGKFDEAIAVYQQALKLRPESVDIHYEYGLLLYEVWGKTYDNAQQKLIGDVISGRRVDHSKPGSEMRDKLLAEYGYKKEYYDMAMTEFAEVLEYDPNNWGAKYYIAVDLYNNKKYTQAIIEFKELIRLKPDYVNNYSILGKCYLYTGQYELAIRATESALKMNPSAQHYYALGLAYKKTGNRKKMDEIGKKLRAMNSDFYSKLYSNSMIDE
jgi:superkiller protein 3